MEWYQILLIAISFIILIFVLASDRVRVKGLIKAQIDVYRAYKPDKGALGSAVKGILIFICSPIAISACLIWPFLFSFSSTAAQAILTAFSILLAIFVAVLTILVARRQNGNISVTEKTVISQTLTTIAVSTFESLILIAILIVYISLVEIKGVNLYVLVALTNIIAACGIHIFLLAAMMVKRLFRVLEQDKIE